MSNTLQVPGMPFELAPSVGSTWNIDHDAASVSVTAAPHSDIFVDPGGDSQLSSHTLFNAATLLGAPPMHDFQFSARVTVGFESTFDAGVLLLWFNQEYWAKLCFEYSPVEEHMVVSVVNREVSDDANSFVIEGKSIYLRVSRIGNVFAYHASTEGTAWRLVRAFLLEVPGHSPRLGFEAQSPHGEGCEVRFDHISFTEERLGDLRDGS